MDIIKKIVKTFNVIITWLTPLNFKKLFTDIIKIWKK